MEKESGNFEQHNVELEAVGLYKLLKKHFGDKNFSLDEIDKIEGFDKFGIEHYTYLEDEGILMSDASEDDDEYFFIAKEIPEAY